MSPGEILRLLLWAGAAAGLGFGSAVILARYAGSPAPVMPLRRLRGWDLPLAGLIYYLASNWTLIELQRRHAEGGGAAWLDALGAAGPALLGGLAGGLLAWLYLGLREGSFAPRRRPVAGRRVAGLRAAATCYLIALPGLAGIWYCNALLVRALGGAAPAPGLAGDWSMLAPGGLAAVLALVVVVLPLFEEALFRGYLWRFLAGRAEFGPRRALVLSALLFALLHDPVVWLPVFCLGGLFGWVYWRSGKLRYAVFVHALHNGLAALATALPWDPADVLR